MSHEDVMVIRGVREDGGKFRPSDWIERISASLAHFGPDNRLNYSRSAQPCIINNEKCLVVTRGLKDSDPDAYEYIMGFAKTNKLCIVEDRRQKQQPVTEDRRQVRDGN